ncbi:uncharacterized protein F4812DRAFT_427249 [Daldinia caldariorum]|uniref:uncharacterized protein n=1 Tax=Daldinia caldariorum TaxID=326644 RepID=UPI0020078DA3|nr:uncharacterized protein F4812DRAFT_427249 [Daldinia caldariorum]KAI1468547.1 hypothetical protein F4812DRAFT_427249 [Daldinia caldariorum]
MSKAVYYPFTPDFDHWVFPHNDIPPPWQCVQIGDVDTVQTDIAAATLTRDDERCRITNSMTALDAAHIIPAAELAWFDANSMALDTGSGSGSGSIDSIYNRIALRKDVHHLWDKTWEIIMFPRLLYGDRCSLIVHAFRTRRLSNYEVRHHYHNRQCQELRNIDRRFLFARFAWSIFRSSTVRLLVAGSKELKLLGAETTAGYPRTNVKVVKSAGQLPRFTRNTNIRPPSGARASKRSRSGPDDARNIYDAEEDYDCPFWHYNEYNEIEFVDDSDNEGDSERSSEPRFWRYTADNKIEYLDTDDDDSRGRKRRRFGSFGSQTPPALSESLLTVSSGVRGDSAAADAYVTKPEREDDS